MRSTQFCFYLFATTIFILGCGETTSTSSEDRLSVPESQEQSNQQNTSEAAPREMASNDRPSGTVISPMTSTPGAANTTTSQDEDTAPPEAEERPADPALPQGEPGESTGADEAGFASDTDDANEAGDAPDPPIGNTHILFPLPAN